MKLNKYDKKLIFDIFILYLKNLFKIKLNYYDMSVLEIVNEYNYILDYKREWSKRKDL